MSVIAKPLLWLHGEIKTPPMSQSARQEAGYLLRRLQRGEILAMPHSRPMPDIGPRCHELRVSDEDSVRRVFLRVDPDAIVILDVLRKKTRTTPRQVLESCRRRLASYDSVEQGD